MRDVERLIDDDVIKILASYEKFYNIARLENGEWIADRDGLCFDLPDYLNSHDALKPVIKNMNQGDKIRLYHYMKDNGLIKSQNALAMFVEMLELSPADLARGIAEFLSVNR